MFYAVGDIHGHLDKLDRALDLIAADGGINAPVIFLGDYVDRGPDSQGVINRLMAGQSSGRDWTCVAGNHDILFWRFVTEGAVHDPHIKSGRSWLHPALGGCQTLMSYLPNHDLSAGRDPISDAERLDLHHAARAAIPPAHLDWIAKAPRLHQAQGFVFVHAGLQPRAPLEWQSEEDLVWIRDPWLNYPGPLPQPVVHGHTSLEFPQHYGHRINLDGGAGHGRKLVPAVCDDGAWFTLDEQGRTPLTP